MRAPTSLPHGGTVAPGFEGVRDAFLEAQAKDAGGAQLCVYRHGERVVDLWAGRDGANDRPYGEDTIGVLMSCTKGVVASGVHILADRGLIDFDAPMAKYWPEFGQAGKAAITVRQVLSHTGGLMNYDADRQMGPAELFDYERSVRELEIMRPLWPPGAAAMYHYITFGTLAAELIRRVDGRRIGRFVAEEIAGPLGIDLWIGLPVAEEARRAPHSSQDAQVGVEAWEKLLAAAGCDLNDRLIRAFLSVAVSADAAIAQLNTSRAFRAAELPAGGGIGDARALAKLYASLIGRVDGVRLIGEAAMNRARAPQTEGLPPPGEMAKLRGAGGQPYGLGYELPSAVKPMLGPGSFGHSGAGGRLGFAHPESGTAVGYVCNTMLTSMTAPDPRWIGWTAALHEALGA
ncbi:MAG TPA: serine hydrolase domain-containing protein [Caulobacteraceae bacterium]|jgi:CubicO group peptidase (beta-lactamase class C family)